MSKFISRTRDGFVWLTADVNGVTYWFHRQGRVGDLIRPGQRFRVN